MDIFSVVPNGLMQIWKCTLNGMMGGLFTLAIPATVEFRWKELFDMNKKNMRRVSMLVTAQTAKNLDRLAAMSGYYEVGRVVDKLVREKMISLRCEKAGVSRGSCNQQW